MGIYNARSAIQSVDIVIEHKFQPTIKIVLRDGQLILGKTDQKTFQHIKIAAAAAAIKL